MANRSYQTITLFGKTEKVKEILNYVISQKEKDFENEFITKVFPISLCSIKDDKIHLETKYAPVGFKELSISFPEVGFKSSSTTEFSGEELILMINGKCIYSVYYNYEEMYAGEDNPNTWELITGHKLKEENIKSAFNITEKGVA
jgi:hypothetical protein